MGKSAKTNRATPPTTAPKPMPPSVFGDIKPTKVLAGPAAAIANHTHTVFYLAYLALSFDSLVADPVPFLARSAIPLAACQVAYTSLALPPTASTASKPGPRQTSAIPSRIFTSILALIVASTVGPLLISAVLILFGAQFNSGLAGTALCALHMSILTVQPLIYAHGFNAHEWAALSACHAPLDVAFGGALGTIIGSWMGAIPIPLDWDRPWQQWPITIVVGSYVGHSIGKLLGGTVFRGKQHFL